MNLMQILNEFVEQALEDGEGEEGEEGEREEG
jgi:hypothetical protein